MSNQDIILGSYNGYPYLIRCITPLHVGSGQSYEGFVDLPIQRDNLGFPTIWGSSIKGAMRHAYHNNKGSDEQAKAQAKAIFGSDSEDTQSSSENTQSSSIIILDASLLLMPVRSIYGLFAFVTHPHLLRQTMEKLSMVNKDIVNKFNDLLKDEGKCICSKDTVLTKDDKSDTVILKEEDIKVEKSEKVGELFNYILPADLFDRDSILKRIVIVDDEHADIIKRSTMVQTRIRIDYSTKIVKEGALWTEEYLPELSILMSMILIKKNRDNSNNILNELAKGLKSDNTLNEFYLVIGGNETIGKGIVKFHKLGS